MLKKNNHISIVKSKDYENKVNAGKCENFNNEKDIGKFSDIKTSINKMKEKFGFKNKFSNLALSDNTIQDNELNSVNYTMQHDMQNNDATIENTRFKTENPGLNNNEQGKVEKETDGIMQSNETTHKYSLKNLNNFFQNFQLLKVFKNKNSKAAVLVVILSIVLIMFLNISNSTKQADANSSTENFNSIDYVSSSNYVKNLENKLVNVLSQIMGAGNVSVMITLESGPELKIANSVDERTNTSTSSSTTTTSVTVVENPIIITNNGKSQPLVLMEIMPVIKGVIVVAQGANNTKVKLELLQAVQALLNVSSGNIQIYAGI